MQARRVTVFALVCLACLSGQKSSSHPTPFRPHALFRAPTPMAAKELPDGAIARLGPHRPKKKDAVEALAFSPDGTTLVSAHQDRTLRVWDVARRVERARFSGPGGVVTALAFAPNGKTVLAAWNSGAAIWTVPGGLRQAKLDAKDRPLRHATFTRDGRALAWLEDKRHVLHLCDVSTSRLVRTFAGHTKSVVALALAPDGKRFASSGEDKMVRLWDLATGKEVRRLEWEQTGDLPVPVNYRPSVRRLVFTPNGWALYAAGAFDSYRLWDLTASGQLVESYDGPEEPPAKLNEKGELVRPYIGEYYNRDGRGVRAFTADSQVLVSTSDGPRDLRYQDLATLRTIASSPWGHTGALTALVFAPRGGLLATGGSDGAILLWSASKAGWARRVPPLLTGKVRDDLWTALAVALPKDVYHARWRVVQASDQGVALIKAKMRPARAVSAEQVRKLAAGLDHDGPEARRRAFEELKNLGPEAGPVLRGALRARPSAELAHKTELLQKAWAQPQPAQALLVLEQINTPQARALLMGLAAGKTGAPLTQGALAALHRLKGRPVAAPLERPKIEAPAAGLVAETTPAPRAPGTGPSGSPLPKGALARIGRPKARDDTSTWSMRAQACLSPDGKALLTLRKDGVLRFWATATGRPLRSLRLKGTSLSLMALSPDGKVIACAGRNEQGSAILAALDTATAALRWSARLPERTVSFLAVAGDGKALAWAVDDEVRLWDLKTGRELRRLVGHTDTVQAGAFSPDGKLLVTIVGSDVRVWDVRTARQLRRLDGHGGNTVWAVVFAPDGKALASVGGDDFLTLWDTTTWRRGRRIPVAGGLYASLAFSLDGKTVAAAGEAPTLSLWDIGTGKLEHRLVGHANRLGAALFARDGKALVSVSEDDTALVWKWPAVAAPAVPPTPAPTDVLGRPLPLGALARMGAWWLRHQGVVIAAAISPDGKRLAAVAADSHDLGIYLWEIETGKQLRRFAVPHMTRADLSFSPDGKFLALAVDQTVYLWAAATGERVQQFLGQSRKITCVAFSPDGKTLAVGGEGEMTALQGDLDRPDDAIRLFNIVTGQERCRLAAHPAGIAQLVFSADGRTLVSYSDEVLAIKGSLCVWSTATGKLLRRLNAPGPSVVLAPDGRTFVYQESKAGLALMDLSSGKTLSRAPGKAESGVYYSPRGFFSPDGKVFAFADDQRRLWLWDLPHGRKARPFRVAGLVLPPACFSPDSKKLVIGSFTPSTRRNVLFSGSGLRLWNITSNTEVGPLPGHRESVTCLAFAPNGRTLVSGSSDKTLRLWEAKTGRELRILGKHGHSLTALAFAPDGRTLAAADTGGALVLCDPASGKPRARVEDHAGDIRFTPDGKALVAVTEKGEVVARNRKARELCRHAVRDHRGAALAVSPDGTIVFSVRMREGFQGPRVGSFLFWDRATDRVIAKNEVVNTEYFSGATFSPDGRMIAVRVIRGDYRWRSTHLRLIEVATGREILRLKEKEGPCAFSPNGRILVVGETLWDLATGKEAGKLTGHRGDVESLAFSPDGTRLASGSADTTILVWQTTSVFKAAAPRGGPLPLAGLWADLAGADAARANTALWRLVTDPSRAVPFLSKKLRPATPPDTARLRRLVADLDSNTFAVRTQAERALEELAELAEPALRAALESKPSLEVHRRVKRLLEMIDGRLGSPRHWQTVRAIAVLERIGAREARQPLEALARGAAGAWVTREANAAVQRLSRR